MNGLGYLKEHAGLASGETLRVITEPFTPFVWKRIVDDGSRLRISTDYLWRPASEEPETVYAKASLLPELTARYPFFAQFATFAGPAVQVEHPAEADGSRQVDFIGERYLFSPQSPARFFGRSDPNFVMQVRLSPEGDPLAFRFKNRGRDAGPWTPVE